MTSLLNRPGYEGMVPLHQAINSLFEQSFLNPIWSTTFGPSGTPGCALDVYEDGENYYAVAVLPGVDSNKVEILAEQNTLTITGEVPSFVPEGKQVVWRELPAGTFRRSLTLPVPVDAEKIQAQYEDGLLKLVLPKANHARVRKIQIGSGQAQLAAGSNNGPTK